VYRQNYEWLSRYFPDLMPSIQPYRNEPLLEDFRLQDTLSGSPTLSIRDGERWVYMHSKYNPLAEAESIRQKYREQIETAEHLVFFGLGLGYHVEEIMKHYPDKTCSIYEPNPYIFLRFLESRSLTHFPIHQVVCLLFNNPKFSLTNFMQSVYTDAGTDCTIITTPVYERLFRQELDHLYKAQIEALEIVKMNKLTTIIYRKRWLMNSLKNLNVTIRSPNILRDMKHVFKGKPIVIAAAGPSLIEDIETLRTIKQEGLAYVFAVGSANKLLLKQGIAPDAVVTYDPQPHNVEVFRELIDSGRTDIPMIYGTSVAYETLEHYPGPKFHMITSVDGVSDYYLNRFGKEPDVKDAMTVSLIAIQLAQKLEAGCIVLVGLNLAFKDRRYYAEGITYHQWKGEAREGMEYSDIVSVRDVNGRWIETNDILNGMRIAIEDYIRQSVTIPVYNATKDGAAIEGTSYVPLEQLLQTTLTESVVSAYWWKCPFGGVSPAIVGRQIRRMEKSMEAFLAYCGELYRTLEALESRANDGNHDRIQSLHARLKTSLRQLLETDCYRRLIRPLADDQYKQFDRKMSAVVKEKDSSRLIHGIAHTYRSFLDTLVQVFEEMNVHMKKEIHPRLRTYAAPEWKIVHHQDGAFVYTGDPEIRTAEYADIAVYSDKPRACAYEISAGLSKAGDGIEFDVVGTRFRILASVHSRYASHVRITVNGKRRTFTTAKANTDERLPADLGHVVYEETGLPARRHRVRIELTEDGVLAFEGVEIDATGRLLHPDEVTDIRELTIGKRIRCHYKASLHTPGTFGGLGQAGGAFIPPESSAEPDGVFYFIMVDEEDGRKMLIADRNVQHSVSWDALDQAGYIFGKPIALGSPDECSFTIRSLKGGYGYRDAKGQLTDQDEALGAFPSDNEWDVWMVENQRLFSQLHSNWNTVKFWNLHKSKQSWCQETPVDQLIHPYEKKVLDQPYSQLRVFRIHNHEGKGLSFHKKTEIRKMLGFRPLLVIEGRA